MTADWMILNSDARDVPLPDESVHLIVTSPPYWGLRKYTGEQELVWGGKNGCSHQWVDSSYKNNNSSGGWQGGSKSGLEGGLPAGQSVTEYGNRTIPSNTCQLCGAWKGSLGLEPNIQMYVDHIVEIFREMKRILRKDGVAFLNIGDSYCSNPGNGRGGEASIGHCSATGSPPHRSGMDKSKCGLKPKDLCMVPARVALALQGDGWWVRSDIIWAKGLSFDEDYVGNPMCESVTDRPSRAHEYIFILTKSERYYWDKYAVVEPHKTAPRKVRPRGTEPSQGRANLEGPQQAGVYGEGGRNLRDVWSIPTSPLGWEMCNSCKTSLPAKLYRKLPKVDVQVDDKVVTKRLCECGSTDWMSHFAAFPVKLIEPMVKAATSEHGCCSNCGASWKRNVKKGEPVLANAWSANGAGQYDDSIGEMRRTGITEGSTLKHHVPIETLGWQPACKCTDSTLEPCTVFDPFTGSGTSAIVACKLGRRFIGTELSEDYINLAEQRIKYTLEME